MKLRFHANTLRLRLSQSDVARLAETGRVEEQVIFAPGQTLSYVIESVTLELRPSSRSVEAEPTGGRGFHIQDVSGIVESGAVGSNVTDDIRASFENGNIRVTIPSAVAARWIESDETGIESSGGPLRVLVEKDFQCLHSESEQDADAFPNPLAQ